MKLYEITEQIRQALQMVADGDMPEDQMHDTLEMLGLDFDVKVDNTAAVIKEFQLEAEAFKSEIDRLTDKKRLLENKADSLKEYLRLEMQKNGRDKVNGKRFTVTIGKPTDVVQLTGFVEEKYLVVKTSEDKVAIKRDLKAGVEVKGAELVSGKTKLIIK